MSPRVAADPRSTPVRKAGRTAVAISWPASLKKLAAPTLATPGDHPGGRRAVDPGLDAPAPSPMAQVHSLAGGWFSCQTMYPGWRQDGVYGPLGQLTTPMATMTLLSATPSPYIRSLCPTGRPPQALAITDEAPPYALPRPEIHPGHRPHGGHYHGSAGPAGTWRHTKGGLGDQRRRRRRQRGPHRPPDQPAGGPAGRDRRQPPEPGRGGRFAVVANHDERTVARID